RLAEFPGPRPLPVAGNSDLAGALARGPRMRGAVIAERVRVTGITTSEDYGGRAVTGVTTDAGPVEAEIVMPCGSRASVKPSRMPAFGQRPRRNGTGTGTLTRAAS